MGTPTFSEINVLLSVNGLDFKVSNDANLSGHQKSTIIVKVSEDRKLVLVFDSAESGMKMRDAALVGQTETLSMDASEVFRFVERFRVENIQPRI